MCSELRGESEGKGGRRAGDDPGTRGRLRHLDGVVRRTVEETLNALLNAEADRYERRSLLVTSNLAFSEWGQVFQGERMTAALLDRLTHRCHIFEMNGESFRESMQSKRTKKGD